MARRFARNKYSFITGEVKPEFVERGDIDRINGAAKLMRNIVPIDTGGFTTRPSIDLISRPTAKTNAFIYPVTKETGNEFIMVEFKEFLAGTYDIEVYTMSKTGVVSALLSATSGARYVLPSSPPRAVQIGDQLFMTLETVFPSTAPRDLLLIDINTGANSTPGVYQEGSDTVGFTGTNTITADSGTSIDFTSIPELAAGNKIRIAGNSYTIASTLATVLTLTAIHNQPTSSGISYAYKTDTIFPEDVTVLKGRVVYIESNTIRFSATYDPFVVKPNVQLALSNTSPISIDVGTSSNDKLYWINAGNQTVVGGGQGEYVLVNPDFNATDNLPIFTRVSNYGSTSATPVNDILGNVTFTYKNKQVVFGYNSDKQRFFSQDATAFANKPEGTTIKDVAFTQTTDLDTIGRGIALNSDNSFNLFVNGDFWGYSSMAEQMGATWAQVVELDNELYLFGDETSTGKYMFCRLDFNSSWALDAQVDNATTTIADSFYHSKELFVIGWYVPSFVLTGVTGSFVAGETVTGGTSGSTAIVESLVGGVLYFKNPSAAFTVGENLTTTSGGAATLSSKSEIVPLPIGLLTTDGSGSFGVPVFNLTGITGTFAIGDVITGGTSNKTATVEALVGSVLYFDNSSGTFTVGENLTSSSGGAATLSSKSTAIPLSYANYVFTKYTVGLPFNTRMEIVSLPSAGKDNFGSVYGKIHKILKVTLNYYNTKQFFLDGLLALKEPIDGKDLQSLSGEREKRMLGWGRQHLVVVEGAVPYKLTILRVTETLALGGG